MGCFTKLNLKLFLLLLHVFVISYFGVFIVISFRYTGRNGRTITPAAKLQDDIYLSPEDAREQLEFCFNKNFSYSQDKGHRRRIPDRFVKFWSPLEITPLPGILSESKGMCKSDTKYVILVNSAISNFARRRSIRSTWGNKTNLKLINVEITFLVGRSMEEVENNRIMEEATTRGDIVVADFIDDYRNLTLKSLIGVKWAVQNCGSTMYAFHADDDIYLDVEALTNDFPSQTDDTLFDAVFCGLKLQRWAKVTRRGIWSSSVAVYGRLYYPPYCNGPCYTMSMSAIRAIYEVSKYTPNDMTVDDIVITGILREKVGLPISMMQKGRCTLLHKTNNLTETMHKMWDGRTG